MLSIIWTWQNARRKIQRAKKREDPFESWCIGNMKLRTLMTWSVWHQTMKRLEMDWDGVMLKNTDTPFRMTLPAVYPVNSKKKKKNHGACSQRNESRSESRFGTWFWPFPELKAWFLPFVNAKLFQIRLFKREKKGVLDRDPPRKADFTLCERKALPERDSCVRILEMRAEATHGSICAVGTKYYIAVRRSCSWLGRRLQCLWTHIVQITKWIAIRNGFRNVIRSFVNRPIE